MRLKIMLAVAMIIPTLPRESDADIWSKAARETSEFVLQKFGRKAMGEGAEAFSNKLATAASRYGDDALNAARKVGPRAISVADDAGAKAPQALKFLGRYGDDGLRAIDNPKGLALFTRYGDDAGLVMMKHPGVAEPLLERLGQPAVKALGVLGPQNARRLAMMGGEASPELLGVIGKYGDPAMDFIWRNKGALAGTAALAGFLANPEPYLKGTNTLATTVVSATVKPVVEAATDIARDTASFLLWALTIMVGAVVLMCCWLVKDIRKPWARSLIRLLRKSFAR